MDQHQNDDWKQLNISFRVENNFKSQLRDSPHEIFLVHTLLIYVFLHIDIQMDISPDALRIFGNKRGCNVLMQYLLLIRYVCS